MSNRIFDVTEVRVSMFAAGINNKENQRPFIQASLKELFYWMTSEESYRLTHELRNLKDEKDQKAFKVENLPFVTFSGTFSYRNAKGLIEHSSLLCFDFDHLGGKDKLWEVRNKLEHDDTFDTILGFTSPRGDGYKWVIRIDLNRATHEEWYQAVCNYLAQKYDLHPDPAPKSVASACFLCYDPNIYVDPKIFPF